MLVLDTAEMYNNLLLTPDNDSLVDCVFNDVEKEGDEGEVKVVAKRW